MLRAINNNLVDTYQLKSLDGQFGMVGISVERQLKLSINGYLLANHDKRCISHPSFLNSRSGFQRYTDTSFNDMN